jgi:hypothetical protein
MACWRTVDAMSAQPDEPYESVPVTRLRHLEAIERHATAEVIAEAEAEEAEIAGVLSEYRQWVADGRPGGASQDEMEQAFADSLRQ